MHRSPDLNAKVGDRNYFFGVVNPPIAASANRLSAFPVRPVLQARKHRHLSPLWSTDNAQRKEKMPGRRRAASRNPKLHTPNLVRDARNCKKSSDPRAAKPPPRKSPIISHLALDTVND
jgi:hypothetical protein